MARPVRQAATAAVTKATTKALPANRVTKKAAPKAAGGKTLKSVAEPKPKAPKAAPKVAPGARKLKADTEPKPKTLKAAAPQSITKASKPVAPESVPEKQAPSKKRKAADDGEESSKSVKRVKTVAAINTPPEQKLDIYVCGDGESGELGLGPKAIDGKKPTNVQRPRLNKLLDASSVGVVQISAGGMHCVTLTHDQKIITWGVNDNGALGRDTAWEAPTRDIDQESNSGDSDSEDGDLNPLECTPTAVPTEDFGKVVPTFVQVVASSSATFALTTEGTVWGWGTFRANDGIFGFFTNDAIEGAKTKDVEKQQQRKPVLVPQLKKIVSLAAGSDHILALDDKGKVFAWGTGEQSQLGRKISQRLRYQSLTPSRVALPKIKQIACGGYHSFAVDEKGLVHAWGSNNYGQTGLTDGIGEGDATVLKPGIIEDLRPYKISHISGGLHHSIACTEDGKLLVWGRCDDGQAGIKLDTLPKEKFEYDERGRPRIVKFAEIPGINAVFVAAGIDNCFAISEDGKAYSWGFSANYRTCQGTDETVEEATMVGKGGVKLSYACCGGQFSVLAGPAKDL